MHYAQNRNQEFTMFYLVKKPLGITSNLVAKVLKRVLDEDRIGFAGTLDPLATGLMIIWTNGSSRLFPLIEHFDKTYKTTIRLDWTTASFDLEQPIVPVDISEETITGIDREKIQHIINTHFTGDIMQIPPNYSAVWIDGRRAYDLVRKWHEVTIEAKKRTIDEMKIISYEWPCLICEITVSHGTYIRSIARDLWILLWTGGYLASLERASLGHIQMNEPREWIQHNDIFYAPLKHEELFPNIPFIILSEAEKKHLRLWSTPLPTDKKNGHYFVTYEDGSYGLLEAKEGTIFPLKNAV